MKNFKCEKVRLEEENKKLKKYYDRDKEELMESCYSLAKENESLKVEKRNLEYLGDINYELKQENEKLKQDVDYRHHRCMEAERKSDLSCQ